MIKYTGDDASNREKPPFAYFTDDSDSRHRYEFKERTGTTFSTQVHYKSFIMNKKFKFKKDSTSRNRSNNLSFTTKMGRYMYLGHDSMTSFSLIWKFCHLLILYEENKKILQHSYFTKWLKIKICS